MLVNTDTIAIEFVGRSKYFLVPGPPTKDYYRISITRTISIQFHLIAAAKSNRPGVELGTMANLLNALNSEARAPLLRGYPCSTLELRWHGNLFRAIVSDRNNLFLWRIIKNFQSQTHANIKLSAFANCYLLVHRRRRQGKLSFVKKLYDKLNSAHISFTATPCTPREPWINTLPQNIHASTFHYKIYKGNLRLRISLRAPPVLS